MLSKYPSHLVFHLLWWAHIHLTLYCLDTVIEISISPPAPLFKFTFLLNFCTRQDLKERCWWWEGRWESWSQLRQSEPEMRKATDLSGSAVMGTAVIFLLISSLYCTIAHHLHYLPNNILIRKENRLIKISFFLRLSILELVVKGRNQIEFKKKVEFKKHLLRVHISQRVVLG